MTRAEHLILSGIELLLLRTAPDIETEHILAEWREAARELTREELLEEKR